MTRPPEAVLHFTAVAPGPAQLLPAREQMAFTLGFHIILVPFGVALTTLMLVANHRGLRESAAAAVALVVAGWGVSHYPCLLGTRPSLDEAASPDATLDVVGVVCAAVVLILPSLVLLFRLAGRGSIGAGPPPSA
ncbi:hypothetical protein [Streptomyces sp. NBC_01477]|uniref:hypothetical protein n=1 Tax=Streptomyces sp. NBC_01477 TaxID=2976015 RepID=UPI003FCC7DA3